MPKDKFCLGLALCFICLGAYARTNTLRWKTEKTPALFSCKIPEDWNRKKPLGTEPGAYYSDGMLSIEALRYGGKGSLYSSPQEYRTSLRGKWSKSKIAVSGRAGEKIHHQYRASLGGADSARQTQWIYEEIVFLPDKNGFWVLDFKSPAFSPQDNPQGLNIWKEFLKSFRFI